MSVDYLTSTDAMGRSYSLGSSQSNRRHPMIPRPKIYGRKSFSPSWPLAPMRKPTLCLQALRTSTCEWIVRNLADRRQHDFLGQLISIMCENNEVGRLNSLGFVGFQKEVEAMLGFKARNSDPLRFPNYYKVLYSWHIARGDYRSGESVDLRSKLTA